MQWRHVISQEQEIRKCGFSRKVILTLFWDFNGPSSKYYQGSGQTVYNVRYCAMLEEVLKSTIRSKQRRMLTNGVVLPHKKSQPHTSAATVETILKRNSGIFPTKHRVNISIQLNVIFSEAL